MMRTHTNAAIPQRNLRALAMENTGQRTERALQLALAHKFLPAMCPEMSALEIQWSENQL
jgi:hypothetical protein